MGISLTIGIWNPSSTDKESEFQYLASRPDLTTSESTTWNLGSRTVLNRYVFFPKKLIPTLTIKIPQKVTVTSLVKVKSVEDMGRLTECI